MPEPTTLADVRRIRIGRLGISDVALPALRPMIAAALAQGRPLRIATANLSFMRLAFQRPDLASLLAHFELCLADGWPVVTLARRSGAALAGRAAGSDLVPLLCQWAAQEGWRIAFVGGAPRLAGRLTGTVEARYGTICAGHWQPGYRGPSAAEVRDDDLAARIRAARADIVLVGLGFPKQERWLMQNLAATGAQVGVGVGASFDFLAGTVSRAPRLAQRLHLEFLWRCLQEPRRLIERYRSDGVFLIRLLNRLGRRRAG